MLSGCAPWSVLPFPPGRGFLARPTVPRYKGYGSQSLSCLCGQRLSPGQQFGLRSFWEPSLWGNWAASFAASSFPSILQPGMWICWLDHHLVLLSLWSQTQGTAVWRAARGKDPRGLLEQKAATTTTDWLSGILCEKERNVCLKALLFAYFLLLRGDPNANWYLLKSK